MLEIHSAGKTDVGRKRPGNEDAFRIDDRLGLYVVSDGMGGHLAGEVASGIVVETLHGHLKERPTAEGREGTEESLSPHADRLLSAIQKAHGEIREMSLANPACRGMGATVSAVYRTGDACVAANVGDSPIYLIHGGRIELVSVLHTVTAEHEALSGGEKSPLDKRFSHVLTRAMGVGDKLSPDLCEIQCFPGDIIVICSDGLSDKLSPEEIMAEAAERPPAEAVDTLVAMANDRGGEDNITVVILRFESPGILERVLGGLARGMKRLLP